MCRLYPAISTWTMAISLRRPAASAAGSECRAEFISLKLDYSLPEPIGGIRFGVSLGVPFARANVSSGSGAAAFHKEKAGLSDIGIAPFVAGWEYDTAIGHVNQFTRLVIVVPTG